MGKFSHCNRRELYFFYGKRNENHQVGAGYFIQHKIDRQLREKCFVSGRRS
jgi:hypothetical protein